MKKMFVGVLLLSFVIVQAEDKTKTNILPATKIGYISAASVLSDTKLGKKLKKELDDKYEKVAKKLQAEEQELMRLGNELKGAKGNITESAFDEKQAKFNEAYRKFETLREEEGRKFEKEQMAANKQLVEETLEVAATIGEQGGYDAIVDRDSGKVLWTASKVDCTKQLLVGLDKKFDIQATKVASASTKKGA